MYCSLRSIKMPDTFLILNWHTLAPLKMIFFFLHSFRFFVVNHFYLVLLNIFFPPLSSPRWLKAVKARSLEPRSQILGRRSLSPILKWPNRIRKRSASISPKTKEAYTMIHQSLTKDLRCTLWLYQLLFFSPVTGAFRHPLQGIFFFFLKQTPI